MRRLSTLAQWRAYCDEVRRSGATVGFVPTMGALHDGHLSLVAAARDHGDVVVMSAFVNPRQFSDARDLAAYPRDVESDAALAQAAGVDAFVTPSLVEMWPDDPSPTATTVSVSGLGEVLEGAGRPGHFDGVASVVAKMLIVTGPARAYFGEKDFQQLVLVRRLVRDLGFAVEVVGCPTRRDDDGLALSSRNVRLSDDGRTRALALSRALTAAAAQSRPGAMRAAMVEVLVAADVDVAYADVVDPTTLVALADDEVGEARAVVAGYVEGVRLIDNAAVRPH